jgi:hypothetical protein
MLVPEPAIWSDLHLYMLISLWEALEKRQNYFFGHSSSIGPVPPRTVETQGSPLQTSASSHFTNSNMLSYKKKSVSFSNTNQYCTTLCRGDYTVREFVASWYSVQEMSNIKNDCRRTVAMLRGASSVGPNVCRRGLEGRTMTGYQQRKQNKVYAYMSVVDEILRQRQIGISDPQSLANEYMSYTRHCAAAAQEMGNLDRLEAAKVDAISPFSHNNTNLSPFKHQLPKPFSIPKVRSCGPFCPAA